MISLSTDVSFTCCFISWEAALSVLSLGALSLGATCAGCDSPTVRLNRRSLRDEWFKPDELPHRMRSPKKTRFTRNSAHSGWKNYQEKEWERILKQKKTSIIISWSRLPARFLEESKQENIKKSEAGALENWWACQSLWAGTLTTR